MKLNMFLWLFFHAEVSSLEATICFGELRSLWTPGCIWCLHQNWSLNSSLTWPRSSTTLRAGKTNMLLSCSILCIGIFLIFEAFGWDRNSKYCLKAFRQEVWQQFCPVIKPLYQAQQNYKIKIQIRQYSSKRCSQRSWQQSNPVIIYSIIFIYQSH